MSNEFQGCPNSERATVLGGTCWRLLLGAMLLVVTAVSGRADWSTVREGLDRKAVVASIGEPLIVNRSRNKAQESWTYDHGAYVQFTEGRVTFWQEPRVRIEPTKPVLLPKV